MADGDLISINDLPRCPEIARKPCCESLRISSRLTIRQLDPAASTTRRKHRFDAVVQPADTVSGMGPFGPSGGVGRLAGLTAAATPFRLATKVRPMPPAVLGKVLTQIDDDLVGERVRRARFDEVGAKHAAEPNFERTCCPPTQGIERKGCLDRCKTCEESRQKLIALDLVGKDLENRLPARQSALLEKSQEQRRRPMGAAAADKV